MTQKIYWIDNLRAAACLMVIVIYTTTWYITGPMAVTGISWNVANLLNSASRVCIPLFFYDFRLSVFWRAQHAEAASAAYPALSGVLQHGGAGVYHLSEGRSLLKLLQKPVFITCGFSSQLSASTCFHR